MDGVWPDTDARGPKCARPPLDRAIADLAAAQHGLIALSQLRDLGLGARGVSHRVSRGALHRVHRGVYGVGHPLLTKQGRYMGAVLACGPGSALSYRSAADLRSLRRTSRTGIDVSSPRRAGRPIAGIDVHSGAALLERDVEIVDGIPCTSVARTLLDLGAVLPRRVVERAFNQAEVLRVVDMTQINDVLSRAGGHRGAAVLRAIIRDYAGSTLTRNDLEEAFLAICRTAGLPEPEVNVWIALEPIGYCARHQSRAGRSPMKRPSGARSANATLLSNFVGVSHSSWPHAHGRSFSSAPAMWRAQYSEQNPSRFAAHVHP